MTRVNLYDQENQSKKTNTANHPVRPKSSGFKTLVIGILAGISILFSSMLKSQTYYPLVQTNKVWNISYYYAIQPGSMKYFKYEGDTVVGPHTYKVLWQTADSNSLPWTPNCFMRETTDHKVYLLGLFGLTEHLIYDFNMNVHDTTYLWGQSMPFIADTVDSVQVLTGEYRKRIVISTPTFPGNDQWIEGVGSVYGLIYSVENTMVGETDTLICMSQNDVLIYHDVAVSTCNSPVQGIQPKAWSSFRIYPVPVQSTLTVELSDQELKQKESLNLVIINSMGETVKSMTVIGSKVVINVEMLPSGLYYAKLFNSSISEAVKFVKE